ncbi:MAG TPA: DUF3365 domain-containing protein [Lacunisphaera sp.]
MKARSYPVVLSLACGFVASSTGWAAAAEPPHAFVDPDDPAVAEIRKLGERTIDQAGSAMIGEVRRMLTTTTAAQAVGKLHLKDYKLPAAAIGRPVVRELHRTSLRVRNPANSPDAAELAALELIDGQLQRGDDVAKVLVQRVQFPGQAPEWRVYRPLALLKQCTDCHGAETALAPGVADALKIFYPADQAVNYKPGEWRGLIRVSIIEPTTKP